MRVPITQLWRSLLETKLAKIIELQTKLQNKQTQLQQFTQQAQELAQNGQQQDLTPLQDRALEVVQEISKKEGIDIVLATASVVFANEDLDISDKVIAELNNNSNCQQFLPF